jgi:hypothetical protein
MKTSRRIRLSWRTAVTSTVIVAATIAGGGYALASSDGAGHTAARTDRDALRYIVGPVVLVGADSLGTNAAKCPKGTFPVGGGPSSSKSVWLVQWSDPDRSSKSAAHPNEWTVGMFNTSGSTADLKVFVVCASANSVKGNY